VTLLQIKIQKKRFNTVRSAPR